MASDKAWYWLAAGVLALGLNGAYQDGEFQWAHHLADRSSALVERVTEQGCRLVALAEFMLGRESSTLTRAQDRLAQLQDRLSAQQVDRMQRQLDAAQSKIERARVKVEVMEQAQLCSRASQIVVHVPRVNIPAMPAVNVHGFMSDVTVPSVRIPEINVPQIKIPPVHVQVDSDDSDGLI